MSHLHLPHPARLSESTRTIREAFWVASICIVAMFAFFMVIGSVSPANAAVATIVVAALAAAYLWHTWYAGRTDEKRDPRVVQARERRGF
jgi:Ca2+/Na+ antiporter